MSGKKTLKHTSGKRVHVERGSSVPFVTVNNNTRKIKYKVPIDLLQPKNLLKAKLKNKANTRKKAHPAVAPAPATSTSTSTLTSSASNQRRLKEIEKRRVLAERQKAQANYEAARRSLQEASLRTMSNFTSFLNRASQAAKARKTAKAAAKLRGKNSNSSNNE